MTKNKFRITFRNLLILPFIILLGVSCNSGESNKNENVKMEDVFSEINKDMGGNTGNQPTETTHINEGIVKEVLQAGRYSYLLLESNNNEEYWVAISKQDIELGEKIVFSDGILKQNFESKEFNRLFEKIYLVSRFQRYAKNGTSTAHNHSHDGHDHAHDHEESNNDAEATTAESGDNLFSDVLKNGSKYVNTDFIIEGLVVKVNYNIMGKNWVHIQNPDNSAEELTITTNDNVMEGETVKFKGSITLNKDFGAGYKYDIIMENGLRQ